MTEITFLFAELIFTAVWLICRAAVWIRQGRIDGKREAMLLLMYVNLAVILRFTFFPMERVGGRVQPLVFDPETALPFRINLSPFVHLTDYVRKRAMLLNHVGNVALFIPSGILLPVLYKKLDGFWKTLAAGVGISLIIEILQLPFSSRISDIDDLILNAAGAAIGYGIYALLKRIRALQQKA